MIFLDGGYPRGGDPNLSPAEAEQAGALFRQFMQDKFEATPETKQTANNTFIQRKLTLDLPFQGEPDLSFRARLFHLTMLVGNISLDQATLYYPGETDEAWGVKICTYISDNEATTVRRIDNRPPDSTETGLMDMVKRVAAEQARLLRDGYNVGVAEVNEVSLLLTGGIPRPDLYY